MEPQAISKAFGEINRETMEKGAMVRIISQKLISKNHIAPSFKFEVQQK